eukprot:GFUD01003058.1.p1 GENE.GFUD01003058.1~~GFUD01003058.1.p1  ORF type:complete len:168 (-),score=23.83 GFUD01003058.1:47-550(-)
MPLTLPKIPRLEKFCFCMDVHTGVKSCTLSLIILWIIYALGALFGNNASTGNSIWAVIWCVANVAAYVLVILAMRKSNKMFIIPAVIISVFNVIVGIIQAIIAFASLWIISAIIILIIVGITAYYTLGLKTVYDDISSATAAAAEPTAEPPADMKSVNKELNQILNV